MRTESTENPYDVTHSRSSDSLQFHGTLDKSNWGMAPAEKRSFQILPWTAVSWLEVRRRTLNPFVSLVTRDCQDGIGLQLRIASAHP